MDKFDLADGGLGGVWEPDWSSVGENGFDEGFEGDKECFFLLPPGGASQRLKNVEAGAGTLKY